MRPGLSTASMLIVAASEVIRVRAATLAADAEFAKASLLRLTRFVLTLLKSNAGAPSPPPPE